MKTLNLNDIKTLVDAYVGDGYGNCPVYITLSQPSIGTRSCVGIFDLCLGMDWEHGQIRIEPTENITSYRKDRDCLIAPWITEYESGGRKRKIINCPKCNNHLRKDNKYCSNCGQRVG